MPAAFKLFGPRERFTRPVQLFGPRTRFTRPSNLAKARRLVSAERGTRVGEGPWGMRTSPQLGRAATNWPINYRETHGGRGVAEVERDTYLNSLREARGAGPIAPQYKPNLWHRW